MSGGRGGVCVLVFINRQVITGSCESTARGTGPSGPQELATAAHRACHQHHLECVTSYLVSALVYGNNEGSGECACANSSESFIVAYVINPFKVRKTTKIRNHYNQVPHLAQDTTCLASFLWNMGKQCRPRPDAVERELSNGHVSMQRE